MTGTLRVTRFIIVVCLGIGFAQAQSLKDHLQKGDRYYDKKDYANALVYFTEALAIDPDNALTNYKAGISSLDQRQYPEALGYLQKAFESKPELDPDIRYHLAIAYQGNHQYAEARKHFEGVMQENKRLAPIVRLKIAECVAGDSLMKLPPRATVQSLDDINTAFSEFAPLISGETLIFSSNRSANSYEIKSGGNLDDVFVSQRQGSSWSSPEKISPNINVKSNEVATSISSDGTTLFLYYEDGGGDIYTSTKTDGVWSQPVPLNRFINHPDYRESAACISSDGKRLFFSSNRPGGKGGFDIYVSELSANGQWGRPSNLGSPVNTKKDEISPFLGKDGTLYFASNGHPSLGDHDLFETTFADGRWSVPGNLGYPINTSGYEGFLTLSAEGDAGFFTSRRKSGQKDTDIYIVTFVTGPNAERSEPLEGDESEKAMAGDEQNRTPDQ